MLKRFFRDALPHRFHLPIKYLYNLILGRLEPELSLLPYMVRLESNVVDIGGNRGIYTLMLYRLGAHVKVFEPNPACIKTLSSWAKDKANVQVFDVALSDHSGYAELSVPVDEKGIEHDSSASIEKNNFKNAYQIHVKTTTLDSYGFDKVDFIKIDVEGHEVSVLKGAQKTILSSYPALLIEIEQRHNQKNINEIFDNICSMGYVGFYFQHNQLKTLQSFKVERDQNPNNFGSKKDTYINNFVFLHRDRIGRDEYRHLFFKWPVQ